MGLAPASIPTPLGGNLLVVPTWIFSIVIPPAGISIPATLPNDPRFCGLSVFLQVIEADPGASQGASFAPGLEAQIGR